MYPIRRMITTCVRALFSSPLAFDDCGRIQFRCMPWDLDLFFEMNNGRILTLYDLGRFDLAIRGGLARLLREKGWGLVVAGSSVRYRGRIRCWDKVDMETRVVGHEGRWVYIVQSMWVGGEPKSSILLRTAVTGKGKAIEVREFLTPMGAENWQPELPDWVRSWICSEQGRPWPPV